MQAKALASGASAPALLRLERGIQFCEEAAQLVLLVEREFDLIEKKYNRLIELKTVFARRALARIHYLLQEGAGVEDSTLELIGLLNHGDKKEALLEELRDSMYVTAPFSIVGDASLYNRRPRLENQFVPLALQEEASSEIADFVPKPLYTGRQLEEFRRRSFSGFGGYGAVDRGSGKASVYLAGGDPEQTGGRPDFAAGGNPSEGRLFLHWF